MYLLVALVPPVTKSFTTKQVLLDYWQLDFNQNFM